MHHKNHTFATLISLCIKRVTKSVTRRMRKASIQHNFMIQLCLCLHCIFFFLTLNLHSSVVEFLSLFLFWAIAGFQLQKLKVTVAHRALSAKQGARLKGHESDILMRKISTLSTKKSMFCLDYEHVPSKCCWSDSIIDAW